MLSVWFCVIAIFKKIQNTSLPSKSFEDENNFGKNTFCPICVFFRPSPPSCAYLFRKWLGELLLDFPASHHGGGRVMQFKRRLIWRAPARTHTEALSLALIVCLCGWDAFSIFLFSFFDDIQLLFFSRRLNEYFKACLPNRCQRNEIASGR